VPTREGHRKTPYNDAEGAAPHLRGAILGINGIVG